MAAIDKMYVKSYYEYDDLLRWSLIYYPKLLNYFYNIHMSYKDFENQIKNFVSDTKVSNRRSLQKIGNKNISLEEAASNIKKHYKEKVNYDASDRQCLEEAEYILEMLNKSDEEIADLYSYPCTNTPFKIDNYLKWHCPLPFVRKYLQNQCGVNPKWEWLYKLFWKGKKEFL